LATKTRRRGRAEYVAHMAGKRNTNKHISKTHEGKHHLGYLGAYGR
jgi:hypothetical protein